MGLFSKRGGNIVDYVAEDKQIIENNLKILGKLIDVVFEAIPEIREKLEELKTRYQFVSPKASNATVKTERKISVLLSNIEGCAAKADKRGDYAEIEGLITKIKLAVAER